MPLIIRLAPYHFIYPARYAPGPRTLTLGEAQLLNDQLELRTKIWADKWWPRGASLSAEAIGRFDGRIRDWVNEFQFRTRGPAARAQAESRLESDLSGLMLAGSSRPEAIRRMGAAERASQTAMAGIAQGAGLGPDIDD